MAVNLKRQGLWWSRIHFLLRLLGLLGLLTAVVGAGMAFYLGVLTRELFWESLLGQHGFWPEQLAAGLLLGGAVAVLVAVLAELYVIIFLTAGRRSASGLSAGLQALLVLAILAGVNFYSFRHYLRLDWTRASDFTLSEKMQTDLRAMKGEVTIVVYQPHKAFGSLSEQTNRRSAAYDTAAERKVVEKVRDLVEQFREFGSQFRVEVLDVDEENYETRLADVTKDRPELRKAIDTTGENTIFFYRPSEVNGPGEVGQLSFNDFYQLDKTKSQETKNLVLTPQGDKKPRPPRPGEAPLDHQYTRGAEPFARKVLSLGERRPKVALGVIHPFLTSQGPRAEWRMKQARRALEAAGFDVKDIILRKTTGARIENEWDALTAEESNLDVKERSVATKRKTVDRYTQAQKSLEKARNEFRDLTLEELSKKYAVELKGGRLTEAARQANLVDLQDNLDRVEAALAEQQEKLKQEEKELKALSGVESLAEKRHISDLKAKMARVLEDCDLLILPRITIVDPSQDFVLPSSIHNLDPVQIEAIKDFLKSGKRLLVCVGPPVEEPSMSPRPGSGPDGLEPLLADLGFRLGRDAVLYETQREVLQAEENGRSPLGGGGADVPPVLFDWKPGAGENRLARTAEPAPQAIRQSMRLLALGVGKDQPLDVKINYPRTVDYDWVGEGKHPGFVFMRTNERAALEPFPFHLSADDAKDKDKKTVLDQGYYPIAAAADVLVPRAWYGSDKTEPKATRVAVIGNGRLFVDDELTPAKERLLANVCNWLVGRDDQLPQPSADPWQYPRVHLEENPRNLWWVGAQFGLPLVFLCLGLGMLMMRQLR